MPSELKRGRRGEALVEAAQKQFLTHGYRRTSIDDVARAAGVAKGTVYLYFRSKEEMFRAVSKKLIDVLLDGARAAAKSEGTVEERLARVLEAKFGTIHRLSSGSAHGDELVDNSYLVSGDLYRDADKAFVAIVAGVLKDLPKLLMKPIEAGWMIFRAAKSVDFDLEKPPSEAEVKKRLHKLAAVLVRGLSG